MTLTFLGTGTSHGIPVIGCECRVCHSSNPRDKRMRASAYVQGSAASILIDAGPDFRQQALDRKITAIDAVLVTHSHADHIHGIDDLRIFSHTYPRVENSAHKPLPLYANGRTLSDIESRFSYIFRHKPTREGGGKPNISLRSCEGFTPENPLVIGSLKIVYIPMGHGSLTSAGWVFSEGEGSARVSIAYLTDCNAISDESIGLIHRAAGLRAGGSFPYAALDGLRERPHSTHFSFDEALECAKKIGAANTRITHLCHDMFHEEAAAYFRKRGAESVLPAYDGLQLTTE